MIGKNHQKGALVIMQKNITINIGTARNKFLAYETEDLIEFFKQYHPMSVPSNITTEEKRKFKQNKMRLCFIGKLKDGRHKDENVISRQALVFDLDNISEKYQTREAVELLLQNRINTKLIVYPSMSCYLSGLRLRVIIPTDFEITNKNDYQEALLVYTRALAQVGLGNDATTKTWSQAEGLPVIGEAFSAEEKANPIHYLNEEKPLFSRDDFDRAVLIAKRLHTKPKNMAEPHVAQTYIHSEAGKDKHKIFADFTANNQEKLTDYNFFIGAMLRIKKCELKYHELTHEEAVDAVRTLGGNNLDWQDNNVKMYASCKKDVDSIDEFGLTGLSYFVPNTLAHADWITTNNKGKIKIDEAKLGKEIQKENHVLMDNMGSIAIFNKNRWILNSVFGENLLRHKMYEKLYNAGFHNDIPKIVNKVWEDIKMNSFKSRTIEQLFNPQDPKDLQHACLIQFENGILDVLNWKWTNEIDPELHIPNVHPLKIDFLPAEQAENMQANAAPFICWVAELINSSDEEQNYQVAEWLLSYIGSMFIRKNAIERFNQRLNYIVLLNGNGKNGKTTLENYIRSMLGTENCTGFSLDTLTNNRFMLSQARFTNANISDEMQMASKVQSKTIKNWTGGGIISAEEKFNKVPIEFIVYASLLFATNEPPMILDDSLGMRQRMIMINFNRLVDDKIKKQFDLKLLYELKPYVALYSLYLIHLWLNEKRNVFKFPNIMKQWRHDWIYEGDSALTFIDEYIAPCCEVNNSGEDLKSLYFAYKKATEFSGGHPLNQINFEKKLQNSLENFSKKRTRWRGRLKQRLIGYVLRPEFFDDFQDSELFGYNGLLKSDFIWTYYDNCDHIRISEKVG